MENLQGKIFGKWTVTEFAGMYLQKWPMWWCNCDCGTRKRVKAYTLKQGRSMSCGCATQGHVTHGMSRGSTYSSWLSMKWRCNTKNSKYNIYSLKGITYTTRWESFENFYEDMGERPEGTSIDRIDNLKGYYKENCRWASPYIQVNNSSKPRLLTYLGVTKSVSGWARSIGMSRLTLSDRLHRKWSVEKALTTPLRKRSTK